ncbi:AraC family transcriptional regulator [Novosphingobium sp. Gsoil 351]|uniref:AraC family transcriptional regulator n=1 Tax=Novosphingobium sp. Gsoil 351 TaxID=2675225 RepID=UPI0012B49FF7|nr:AraC family transcriptional regulator [Novosphingobium sp. Gsoil 351]QGN55789.1 helix-turn-helix domain-containing protein [Novosphingobium sp. Gsoil 351]
MHQIRAVSLYSYLDVASLVGIDGYRLLRSAGISPLDLEDPQVRLPATAAITLLERSAKLSGCDSFGIRMAQCRSFASLGPISLLLERLGTVGEVLTTMSASPRILSDVLRVSTEAADGVVAASFEVAHPLSQPQAADLTIGLGFVALVGASHGRWHPEAIHFTHGAPRDRQFFEQFFRADLAFDSAFNGFSFDSGALATPLPLADKAMADNARRLLDALDLPAVSCTVSDHARHTIALLLPAGRSTLDAVAHNLNRSGRVLQRQLHAEGHTFVELLRQVRRDLALRYIARSSQSLTVISESLGYSTIGSFTRWFHDEFGMPPSAWRKAKQELPQPPPTWKV